MKSIKVVSDVSVWATGVSVGVNIEKSGETLRAAMRGDEMDNSELKVWDENNKEVLITDEERDYLTEHLGNIISNSIEHSDEFASFQLEELS